MGRLNRGALKLRTARLLGAATGESADALDEDDLLDELANEAVLDVLARTRLHVRSAGIQLQPGREFNVDTAILRLWNLSLNGGPALQEGLLDNVLQGVYTDEYASPGYNRIVFAQEVSDGDVLTFQYTPLPAPMNTDDDDPSDEMFGWVPTRYHRVLVDYMCWHAADKLGDQGSQRGEKYRVRYEGQTGAADPGSGLARIREEITLRLGRRTRVRRARESLASDRQPQFWTG